MSDTMVEPDTELQEQPQQDEQEIPVLYLHAVERHYRQGDETLDIALSGTGNKGKLTTKFENVAASVDVAAK